MLGLRVKLAAFALGFALIVGLAVIALSSYQHRAMMKEELLRRGQAIFGLLASDLGEAVYDLDREVIAARLAEARRHKDVTAVFAFDESGIVLTDGTEENPFGGGPFPDLEGLLQESLRVGGSVHERRDERLLFVRPLWIDEDRLAGYLHLELSTARADALLAGTRRLELIVVSGLLLAGTTLSIGLSRTLSRQLGQIRRIVEAMHADDFDVRVDVLGRGPLADTTQFLNSVASRIQATTSYKNFMNNMLQSMADCLIIVDTNAVIRAVNRATLDLVGYTEEQLIGQPVSLVVIEEGYQLSGSRLEELLGQESKKDHEVSFRKFNGRLVPISLTGSTIRDNSEAIVGYVCIGTDITDRKMAESERESLNRQLVEASRQAGMAEVATGVLHNVGNVLNSVTVSATFVSDMLRKSKLSNLERAVALFSEHGDDLDRFLTEDDKGRLLPGYLTQLSDHLSSERSRIIDELTALNKHVGHIKEIIGMQQSFSKTSGVIERAVPAEMVEDAVRMNADTLTRNKVQIVRSYADVPLVKTDQHKVLQILVNLISNACDAMVEHGGREKVLRLRILHENARNRVRMEVCDNGVGIAEENLNRVFTHGFTTKKKGHGFGLHSAALAAKELGGMLTVVSDGPGKGATFALELPMDPTEVRA